MVRVPEALAPDRAHRTTRLPAAEPCSPPTTSTRGHSTITAARPPSICTKRKTVVTQGPSMVSSIGWVRNPATELRRARARAGLSQRALAERPAPRSRRLRPTRPAASNPRRRRWTASCAPPVPNSWSGPSRGTDEPRAHPRWSAAGAGPRARRDAAIPALAHTFVSKAHLFVLRGALAPMIEPGDQRWVCLAQIAG